MGPVIFVPVVSFSVQDSVVSCCTSIDECGPRRLAHQGTADGFRNVHDWAMHLDEATTGARLFPNWLGKDVQRDVRCGSHACAITGGTSRMDYRARWVARECPPEPHPEHHYPWLSRCHASGRSRQLSKHRCTSNQSRRTSHSSQRRQPEGAALGARPRPHRRNRWPFRFFDARKGCGAYAPARCVVPPPDGYPSSFGGRGGDPVTWRISG